jgi:hypothetical protein
MIDDSGKIVMEKKRPTCPDEIMGALDGLEGLV